MIITVKDIEPFGGVIIRLFKKMYPEGTTLEQMQIDASNNGWIRMILSKWGKLT